MPHYKNSDSVRLSFPSMWVHKFFKRMISSSNFVSFWRGRIQEQVDYIEQLFYFHATRILLMRSTNWMSKILHQKAFICDVDVSDTVKAISVEIDQNSLNEHLPYTFVFVTVTVSVIVRFNKHWSFVLNIRFFLVSITIIQWLRVA